MIDRIKVKRVGKQPARFVYKAVVTSFTNLQRTNIRY